MVLYVSGSGGLCVPYGLLYNYMYAPNVVRDAPVAVVDMSRTPLSRSYIRLLDATPQARVLTNNANILFNIVIFPTD